MSFDFNSEAARCRAAQAAWARQLLSERLAVLQRWRQRIVAGEAELAQSVTRDVGRAANEVLATDILPTADALRFLERHAGRILRPRHVPGSQRPWWLWGERESVHRRPHGVVGIIGTWNYPILLNAVPIAQALTAGNGVLWKPSELAARSAALLHQWLLDAGLPADLLQLLPADRDAGEGLIEADINYLLFTGSVAVGRKIAARLGERLIPSTLELSGCDAIVVLHDADLAMATRAAWYGTTLNGGQTCISCRRAFVHRSHYAAFLDRLQPLVAAAPAVTLALPAQATHARRLVAEAIAKGARPLANKEETDPQRFAPTVLAEAAPTMAVAREVSFAPLLAVIPFDDEATLPAVLEMCEYNLAVSLFTAEPQRAEALAASLRVGSVIVNDTIAPTAHPSLPFGGVGPSGWGVTRGEEGLLAMTVPQPVSVRSGRFRPHYDGADQPGMADLLGGLLAWQHAARFRVRCRGFRRMLRGAFRFRKGGQP